MPLGVLLVLINIGYSISGWTVIDDEARSSVAGHLLVSRASPRCSSPPCSAPTPRRGSTLLMRGCVIGGVIASLAAIIGYFRMLPGR